MALPTGNAFSYQDEHRQHAQLLTPCIYASAATFTQVQWLTSLRYPQPTALQVAEHKPRGILQGTQSKYSSWIGTFVEGGILTVFSKGKFIQFELEVGLKWHVHTAHPISAIDAVPRVYIG